MKKVTFLSLTVVTVAIAAMAVFYSCGKQDAGDTLKLENPALSDQDVKINNLIKSFRAKMVYFRDHPEYKSGEVMEVDSAKWYLDATFNWSYAFTEKSFSSFNSDTFSIVLNKTNEQVNLEDVFEAFNEIKEKTLEIYYTTEGEQKELYVSYLEIKSNTPEEAVIKATVTIGATENSTPPNPPNEWGPFMLGDDWMYGEKLGDCSPGGGIWWNTKDAATEIEDATNTYRYKYIQDQGPGWYAYYTEPSAEVEVTVYNKPPFYQELLRNPSDNLIDNYRDYLLTYQRKDQSNGLVIETCIPWEDMNFYYHGTHKVIYQIIQENYDVFGVSSSLTFYSCSMEGKGEGGTVDDPDYAYHSVTVQYKTRHIGDYSTIERRSINE